MSILESNKHPKHEITVSNGTIFRILFSVFIFLAFLMFLSKTSYALLLILIAFFFALALNEPVQWLAEQFPKRKGTDHRAIATVLSYLVVVIFLGLFVANIATPVINQTKSFVRGIPTYVNDVQDSNSDIGRFIDKYKLKGVVDDFSNQLKTKASHITGSAVSLVSTTAESVVAVITVIVLSFMMLVEAPKWKRAALRLIPRKQEAHAMQLGNDMYRVVRGYVNGQVILALIAAILILPALLILGINNPIALTFVIFLFGLIPFVGHTISATIITIVAAFHSVFAAVAILLYYILYINIENYVIQPRLQAFTTNMSPLMVLASVVIGVSFGGIVGGLLSIPVAGCLKVLVVDYITRNKSRVEEAEELIADKV